MALYGPTEAAELLNTSSTTIRRWSEWFAEHLTEDARPGSGARRAFTDSDIATFRRAQKMLRSGLTWEQVNEQLAIVEPEEAEPEPAHEAPGQRAQQTEPSAALVLWQRMLDAQAGQIEDQRGRLASQEAQLADQAARLRDQAAQISQQAAELASLRERLARLEEAERRRGFRWPWQRPQE